MPCRIGSGAIAFRSRRRQLRPIQSANLEARPGVVSRGVAVSQPDRPALDRPLLAIDTEGEQLAPGELPPRAVLAFGTERYGLSDELSARADASVSIPMRPGVSSLNLATSVAAVLFAWRLSG